IVERVRQARGNLVRERRRHGEIGALGEAERQGAEQAPTDMERGDGTPSRRERPLGLAAEELGITGLRDLPREMVEPPHPRVGAPHAGRGDQLELSLPVEEMDANQLQTVADEKRGGGVRALTD